MDCNHRYIQLDTGKEVVVCSECHKVLDDFVVTKKTEVSFVITMPEQIIPIYERKVNETGF